MKKPKAKVLKVRVTKDHITRGEPQDTNYCPIALALEDLGLDDINVEGDVIEFRDPATELEVSLDAPKCISKFVGAFDDTETKYDEDDNEAGDDRHERVKPFSFEIQLPVVLPGKIRC